MLRQWVLDYETLEGKIDDLDVLVELTEDSMYDSDTEELFSKCLKFLSELEFKNMLSTEGDELSAVLQITAGSGGTESCDWAEMLNRMYLMWAQKRKFKIRELNNLAGDVAGIKKVTIEIEGDFAFGWLKGENGVHRLVRISLLLIVMQKGIRHLPQSMSIP